MFNGLQIVVKQAVLRHFLVFRARLSVVGVWVDAYSAARGEESDYLDVFGLHQSNQILHDCVHAVLVEVSVVAETEEIEFQTLRFHHQFAGQVVDADLGEVRLSGDRAEGGKFRTVESHPVVVVRVAVLECFQHLRRIVSRVLRLASERLQVVLFSVHILCVNLVRFLKSGAKIQR